MTVYMTESLGLDFMVSVKLQQFYERKKGY